MNYSDFQNLPSSEKITLAILSASKRLMGWSVHSGSVYKLENFDFAVISKIEDSGSVYTAVSSVGSIVASTYFLDRETNTLYLRTTGSDNPNGRFLVVTVNLHYASVPVVLPHDLNTGDEVQFEPLIKSTSEFGVEIDTINQTSESIEGAGSLTLSNDYDFWPKYFDKLSFENQPCRLYSYHRDLDPQQAQIIFKGTIDKQSYSKESISFQLKDQFAQLKNAPPLALISELGMRTGEGLLNAKQRMILGRVFGHVPTNLDQVLDGYPLTGTVSVAFNTAAVTGTGTQFLKELSPDDKIIWDGEDYTVATVESDTALTLTQEYTGLIAIDNAAVNADPELPKRHMNRTFQVAGHVLRQPSTEVIAGSTIQLLRVASTRDIYAGDWIYVGVENEAALVDSVIGDNYIRLATSLSVVPEVGTTVVRPAIQNVRIGKVPLVYKRDYDFDPTTGILTLNEDAENNAAPIYQMGTNVTFVNGSRSVTGSGFQGIIQPGYMLGVVGNTNFFEVLSVESDEALTLRTPSNFNDTANGRYKSLVFDPENMVLTLDALGRTDDGTTDGVLLKTAPAISRALLEDLGLGDELNVDSFVTQAKIAYQDIGLVIPTNFGDVNVPSYRDILNRVNKSVFGALVQNSDFKFAYQVLSPRKPLSAPRFSESDIIGSPSVTSTAENVVKTSIVVFRPMEHNYLTEAASVRTEQKFSETATHVVKTDRSKTIETVLVEESDARIAAGRWSFILQYSAGRISFATKLQGARLEVGDIIEIEHRKLYERFGSSSKRKLLMVESVKRTGTGVNVESTDLSNTFNRVAAINDFTESWTDASEDEKLYGGYYTDEYGLIDNNPSSFETNLIW